MPDFTQPVEPMFIALSIGGIFVGVAIGILLVQIFKKSKRRKAEIKRKKKAKNQED